MHNKTVTMELKCICGRNLERTYGGRILPCMGCIESAKQVGAGELKEIVMKALENGNCYKITMELKK